MDIFPDRTLLVRLVGAVVAKRHDQWVEGHRYLSLDILRRSRLALVPTDKEEQTTELGALSAKQTQESRDNALHHANGLDPSVLMMSGPKKPWRPFRIVWVSILQPHTALSSWRAPAMASRRPSVARVPRSRW